MKMTLPFKPHVLALICSAGLCAASAGLYIKAAQWKRLWKRNRHNWLCLTLPQLRFLQRFPHLP